MAEAAVDLASIKARLPDVPGIEAMSVTFIAGRAVFGMDGKIAAVGEGASDTAIDAAIRRTFGATKTFAATNQPQGKPMSSVTGARSASASLKQMMAEAKQSVADGMAEVQAGIEKHAKAGAALKTLGGALNNDGDDLLATVGQFTNDLG